MAFTINCNNKGCGKMQEPYLDPKDNKAYCSVCDRELTQISSFAKTQMKASKQFKQKSNEPYSVKCSLCNKEGTPKILNDDVVCARCQKPIQTLSSTFKSMLKEKLKNRDV